MGCCCLICFKCGHIFCGWIPLRLASFISCFCMFVTSLVETIGEFYLIKPMIDEDNVGTMKIFVFISAKVVQSCLVCCEMFMAYGVWKKLAQLLNISSILFVIFKGIKLLISFLESVLEGEGKSFMLSSIASAAVFLLPVLWGYQRQIKQEKAEPVNQTNEEQDQNTSPNQNT